VGTFYTRAQKRVLHKKFSRCEKNGGKGKGIEKTARTACPDGKTQRANTPLLRFDCRISKIGWEEGTHAYRGVMRSMAVSILELLLQHMGNNARYTKELKENAFNCSRRSKR